MKIRNLFVNPMKFVKNVGMIALLFAGVVCSSCESVCVSHPYLGCRNADQDKVVEPMVSLATPTFHLQLQYPTNGFSVMDQESQLAGAIFKIEQHLPNVASATSRVYSLPSFPMQSPASNVYIYTITLLADDAKKFVPGPATIDMFVPNGGVPFTVNITFGP